MASERYKRDMLRVRIEAPSSPFSVERLAAGVARLRDAGCDVDDSHAGPRGRHAYLNGSDVERKKSLERALHSDVDVVWLARGGYGLSRIAGGITVPRRGPVVCGFSDATALFAQLSGTGVPCVHGPLATTIAAEPDDSFAHCLDVLMRRAKGKRLPVQLEESVDVDGTLFAGNLCVLAHLCGTPSMPSLEGSIVVLEEIGERPYRIDRMLTQLRESGAFVGVRAVIVGHLTDCAEPVPLGARAHDVGGGARDPAPAPLDVFRERLGAFGIPVAHGITVGHEPPCTALPLGVRARLSGAAGTGTLELLEDLPGGGQDRA